LRLSSSCLKCILDVRLREILESGLPDEAKTLAACDLIQYVAEVVRPRPREIITYVASLAFRRVKELVGSEDPYLSYKLRSEEVARRVAELVEERVEGLSGYERFRALVVASINANSIDPGIASYTFDAAELSELVLRDELAVDDTEEIYRALRRARAVAYLLDNCGESILDKLLIAELRSWGLKVYAVAKGGAYQNDVTVSDALRIGLDEVAELVSTESDFSSLIPGTYSERVEEALRESDLVVAKGMAHYETLSELELGRPVAFLLRAKCEPVARSLGVGVGKNVALLRPQ